MGEHTKVVATGGLAPLIGNASKYIKAIDDYLTLEGLRIIWERNSGSRREAGTAKPKAVKVAETVANKSLPSGKARPSSH